jgi:hypothetical protein
MNPDLTKGMHIPIACRVDLKDWRGYIGWYGEYFASTEAEAEALYRYRDCLLEEVDYDAPSSLYFNPEFEKQFPTLVNAIKQLPFKHLYTVVLGVANNARESTAHRDTHNQFNPFELDRVNIQVNAFGVNGYFLQDGDKKYYPRVSKEYPCYVFNNKDVLHGADPVEHPTSRMLIVTGGILDKEKYQALLDTSLEKFKEAVIHV